MSAWSRCVLLGLLSVSSVACRGSTTMPSAALNLSGTWSGLLGQSASGTALRVTWVATQSGNTISGSATLIKPAADVPATGPLVGTLAGTQLSLTYMVSTGGVPGFANCSISGSGSATATGSTISGSLAVTFTSCAGSGLEPTGSNQLMLTKQ